MKFTIIVPMYNVAEYIGECIESVLNQTYGDFELILIDDESTDETLKIAMSYQKRDHRIVLLTKKHGGLPQTRNYGLKVSKGEYIMLLDGDDYFSPDHLEKAKVVVDHYNCDMTIGNNHINFTKSETKKITLFPYHDYLNTLHLDDKINFIFDKHNLLPACAVLTIYKKIFLTENHISYGEQYSCSEDLDIFMHSISKVKSICFFEHEFYYYRQDNSNAMTKNMTAEMLQTRLNIYKKWFDYFNNGSQKQKNSTSICNAIRKGVESNIDIISTFKLKERIGLKNFIRDNAYLWICPDCKIRNFYVRYYFFRPINRKNSFCSRVLNNIRKHINS